MELDNLLKEIEAKMSSRDLSDSYLAEKGYATRADVGIGECVYGITMIPCEWVYNYLLDYKKLLEKGKGDK